METLTAIEQLAEYFRDEIIKSTPATVMQPDFGFVRHFSSVQEAAIQNPGLFSSLGTIGQAEVYLSLVGVRMAWQRAYDQARREIAGAHTGHTETFTEWILELQPPREPPEPKPGSP